MTIRTDLSHVALMGILNTLPTSDAALTQYIGSVLNPEIQITAVNCGTQLGTIVAASALPLYLGQVTEGGDTITSAYIKTIPPGSSVNIRTLSTCTAPAGVCQLCLMTYMGAPYGNVGDFVRLMVNMMDMDTYVHTLIHSYWGSLFTAKNISYMNSPLPVRRQLYYSNLQPEAQVRFINRLGLPDLSLKALLSIQDPFEQFLAMTVFYAVGGAI